MVCDRKRINDIVRDIRKGEPPPLPAGKHEEFWILDGAFGSFGTFGIREWLVGESIGTAWALQWKRNGRQHKKHVGSVHVFNTDQAFEAAKNLAAKIQLELLDPQAAKREAMRAAKVTFEAIAPVFLEQRSRRKVGGEINRGVRAGTLQAYKRHFTGYYFAPLHRLPIDEITGEQIQTQLDRIALKSGTNAAWACWGAIRAFFTWAIKTHKLPPAHRNPMSSVLEPQKGKARDRVLTNDEIRLIWKACEEWEAEVVLGDELQRSGQRRNRPGIAQTVDPSRAVRLLFLTGCRSSEISKLKWSEVDLKNGELCIPGDRTKNEQELCLPLPDMALDLLRKIEERPGNPNVFGPAGVGIDLSTVNTKITERIANPDKPGDGSGRRYKIDPAKEQEVRDLLTAGIARKRAGQMAHVHWSTVEKIKERMAAGIPIPETPKAPAASVKLPRWTIHDIRRTFRTKLSECGVSREIAERLLNHLQGNPIERTYDRHEYWVEKREALIKWEAKLRSIVDGTAEKIVTPKFGRRAS